MARREGVRPPYWTAGRLIGAARADWPAFDGWAASRGVDPLDLPADRFCNLAYSYLTRDADARQRRDIDSRLDRPPTGADVEAHDTRWDPDAELAAFRAAAG